MKNILITFLSPYRPGKEPGDDYVEYKYHKDENNELTVLGFQTNDAPGRVLIKKARSKMDKVFILATEEIYSQIIDYKNEQYSNVICRYIDVLNSEVDEERKLSEEDVVVLPVGFKPKDGVIAHSPIPISLKSQESFSEIYVDVSSDQDKTITIFDTFRKAIEPYRFNGKSYKGEDILCHVDFTGGPRDINYLMTALLQYIETIDIKCKRIVYSDYERKRVVKLNYIYNVNDLIIAMNEFISTGNANKLQEFSRVHKESLAEFEGLFSSIQDFSEAMSICAVEGLDKKIREINKYIKSLDEDGNKHSSFYSGMISLLIPLMRKLLPLDDEIDYCRLIKWCLNNNMIQQALTLIESKLPEIIAKKGFLQLSRGTDEISKKYFQWYYYVEPNNTRFYFENIYSYVTKYYRFKVNGRSTNNFLIYSEGNRGPIRLFPRDNENTQKLESMDLLLAYEYLSQLRNTLNHASFSFINRKNIIKNSLVFIENCSDACELKKYLLDNICDDSYCDLNKDIKKQKGFYKLENPEVRIALIKRFIEFCINTCIGAETVSVQDSLKDYRLNRRSDFDYNALCKDLVLEELKPESDFFIDLCAYKKATDKKTEFCKGYVLSPLVNSIISFEKAAYGDMDEKKRYILNHKNHNLVEILIKEYNKKDRIIPITHEGLKSFSNPNNYQIPEEIILVEMGKRITGDLSLVENMLKLRETVKQNLLEESGNIGSTEIEVTIEGFFKTSWKDAIAHMVDDTTMTEILKN